MEILVYESEGNALQVVGVTKIVLRIGCVY